MRAWLCIGVLWLSPSVAAAQTHPNLDFEDGLRGWTATGTAFEGQPVDPEAPGRTRVPASPLGGDYWNLARYPLGHQGRFVVATDDAALGTLVSDEFTLQPEDRHLSVLVGGPDTDGTRVELQILEGDAAVVAWTTSGPGIELLQLRSTPILPTFAGRRARIAIIDAAPQAHITVDRVRLTSAPPRAEGDGPVWGIGDYHAHPMSYLAFGALRGVHALWGRPGGAASAYARDPSLIDADLPQCPNDHHGGHSAGILINTLEKRVLPQELQTRGFGGTLRALWKLLTGEFTRHPDDGAPSFDEHPSFLAGAHMQMHVTQIHRAWQGGLRLMSAVAVHNEGAEFLASPVRDAPPSSERETLDAQVCGMRRLAALNADWMQIAYSPAEARDIVRSGRLAVVLGAEFDRLGEMGFASADDEVQYLWDLGIRQVTPIHGIDNRLGGVAVFEPAYNSQNDLLKRGPLNLGGDDLSQWQPVFFDVREGGCTAGPLAGRRGECVLFRLGPAQDRVIVSRTIFSPFSRTPMLRRVEVPQYRQHAGHLNARGLTDEGRSYLRLLVSRGMLVGLEHMSQQTIDDVNALLAETGYPRFVGHAHFRALAFQDRRQTTAEGFLPDEHDIADRTAEMVRASGGVMGIFATENPIDTHPLVNPPFANDCAGSSKTFALSLLYGLERLGGTRVGLASDFTFIPQTVPRFGEAACWALKDHWDARPGAGPLREQYQPERQDNGVVYAGRQPAAGVRAGTNAPLQPFIMGRRTFDFNVDGLAHYGMLPDLLQDLRNIGLGTREFEALFSSAEAYIAMWEKAAGLATRPAGPFTPRELPCDQICRGLCP